MIFQQSHHTVTLLAPKADVLTGTVTSDYVSLENYSHLTAILQQGVGATGTSTITVQCASDVSGTGAEAIAFKYSLVADTTSSDLPGDLTDAAAAGFATTAGSNQNYIIEVDGRAFPDGKPYVAIKSVEVVDSPIAASIIGILSVPRYGGEDMKSAIV